ncbi:NUDIX hydrolase [Sediminibacterium soli]|uniref:NUDIX hydrolase n=1 Tax=Sediminibacterium soli TaxID=2698829 RepID=UPI00137B17A7|nr:NUDIX domain-containing protein [Sediminibacterium soli]NCI48096.1 NUDIX hydrolase [Sediminibacterium soli]
MQQNLTIADVMQNGGKWFMPSLSLDCVIFGFHENQMKVLLLKMKNAEQWALPGGFIYKDEDIEEAAIRVLRERTGIHDIFLQQFHVFGRPGRSDKKFHSDIMKKDGIKPAKDHWILQRFLTVGYYALVDFAHAIPHPDGTSTSCEWWDIHEVKELFMDHKHILDKALETLRLQLNHQPIGYTLLPQKFTMPELQKLYETILDKKLDRRNFQRRMMGYGILKRLSETRKGGAHKAPYLYSFDLRRYKKALQEGLQGGW